MLKQILVCLLFLFSLSLSAQIDKSSALDQRVTIQFTNATVPATLRQLNRVSGLNYSSVTNIFSRNVRINRTFMDTPVRDIVKEILKAARLNFREINGTVIILKQVFSDRKIKGTVVDASNGAPLPFANIFIQNGTQGTASDAQGEFVIEDVPNISFNLVISYVSYKTKTIPISPSQSFKNEGLRIELTLDPIALETISVTGRATKRRQARNERRLFKRFKTDFLGGSENAEKCRIINPQVLQFEVLDSLENYRVTAEDVLYVENYALGYKVAYLLEEFVFQDGFNRNVGQAKFTELEAKSRKKYSKWEVERERSYRGSPQHFLNALIQNNLSEQGFAVNMVNYDSVTSEYTTRLNPPAVEDILNVEAMSNEFYYMLHANSDIEVTYKEEYEDSDYKKRFRSTSKSGNYKYTDKKVKSSIALSDNTSLSSYEVFGLDVTDVELFQKSIIFFTKSPTVISMPGQFLMPKDILIAGWWRWGAMSDRLPLNYRPN